MNILILTGIFPPDVGGPATYVPRIADYLQERGDGVEIITAGTSSAGIDFSYPVHRIPRTGLKRYLRSVPRIADRADWADVLYINGLELDNYLASYFHDRPVVQKCVGDRSWERYRNNGRGNLGIEAFQERYPGLRSWLERTFFRSLAATSDRYVVPSRYLKSILVKWGVDSETISVIHNHSHPPESIPRKTVDWPGSGLRLLTVGRLVPWKRVPGIIRRLPALEDAGLIVLGDGPEFSRCEEAAATANVTDRVVLRGNVTRETVWQHLRDADLLLLNSTYEGFPHILLEAVESGTAAVVADSGGSAELAEFFPDRIHLYDRDRPDQLVERIRSAPSLPDEPPDFPDVLNWETIADQTRDVLGTTGR